MSYKLIWIFHQSYFKIVSAIIMHLNLILYTFSLFCQYINANSIELLPLKNLKRRFLKSTNYRKPKLGKKFTVTIHEDSDFSYKLLIMFVSFHVQQPYFVELLSYLLFKFVQSFSTKFKSPQN